MSRSRSASRFDASTSTVIGAGFTIHAASLSGADNGSMRVDGNVIGNIDISGVLNLSDTGFVDGDITVDTARIAGRVLGNIRCKSALHLTSTAEVMGDVLAGTIIIDDGVVFHGICQTQSMPLVPKLADEAFEDEL